MVAWIFSMNSLVQVFLALSFRSPPSQRVVRCVELCPQALNRPDLPFEGAGNGPIVITWIGREHELYSGASPILLVEHCVRHDRRLLSPLGFVHNWPTSRWSETKKENRFSFKRKWNHVLFSRVTILSFNPVFYTRINHAHCLRTLTGYY